MPRGAMLLKAGVGRRPPRPDPGRRWDVRSLRQPWDPDAAGDLGRCPDDHRELQGRVDALLHRERRAVQARRCRVARGAREGGHTRRTKPIRCSPCIAGIIRTRARPTSTSASRPIAAPAGTRRGRRSCSSRAAGRRCSSTTSSGTRPSPKAGCARSTLRICR